MIATGRRLGAGRLERTPRGYMAAWTDASGKRHRRVLSTDQRVAARAFASIVRDRDLEVLGLRQEEGQERRLNELRDAYLADVATWASPNHLRRIRGVLEMMISEIGPVRVLDLRVDRIHIFRQKRIRRGRANRSVNLECGILKAMLNWAVACGLIGRNPVAGIKPLPAGKAHEKRPRRALSREEIDRLLAAAEVIDAKLRARHAAEKSIQVWGRGAAHRDRRRRPYVTQAPLWRTLVWTGARWGELTAARWADFQDGCIRLRAETTKSKKQRVIPLLDAVAADLQSLRAVHEQLLGRPPEAGEFIFLGPRGRPVRQSYRRALYRFRDLLAEAGVPGEDELGRRIDIHALRHTFASELGRAGVGLTQAQALLGHSDPRLTSQIYTHLEAQDLRGAVERLQGAGQAAARKAGA